MQPTYFKKRGFALTRRFRAPVAAVWSANRPVDTTEENLQSRSRGVILMALSNKFGGLLLTTGNKSEYAVGYATIYGDMCGGYAPIKDLYKTEVFALARWRNTVGDRVVPEAVIERIADPDTRIVSLTITEGGYFIDPATGQFNPEFPEIAADGKTPDDPQTVGTGQGDRCPAVRDRGLSSGGVRAQAVLAWQPGDAGGVPDQHSGFAACSSDFRI